MVSHHAYALTFLLLPSFQSVLLIHGHPKRSDQWQLRQLKHHHHISSIKA
jgi:hypothetical protein